MTTATFIITVKRICIFFLRKKKERWKRQFPLYEAFKWRTYQKDLALTMTFDWRSCPILYSTSILWVYCKADGANGRKIRDCTKILHKGLTKIFSSRSLFTLINRKSFGKILSKICPWKKRLWFKTGFQRVMI